MVAEFKVKVMVIVGARHLVQQRFHECVTQDANARGVAHQGIGNRRTAQGHHFIRFDLKERERVN